MVEYKWTLSDCGASEYPVSFFDTRMNLLNGSSIDLRSDRVLNNGWGEASISEILNETPQSVPLNLIASWYSIADNRFFTCFIEFNIKGLQKILQEGCLRSNSSEILPFEKIIIGAGPAGHLVVWLSAPENQIIIGEERAKEFKPDWKKLRPNSDLSRSQYAISVLERLKIERFKSYDDAIQTTKSWVKLRSERYNYSLKVIMDATLSEYHVQYYNAEKEYINKEYTNPFAFSNRGIPMSVELKWSWRESDYFTKVLFDPEEIMKAFESHKSAKSFEIQFLVSNWDVEMEILVSNNERYISLNKANVEIFK